MTTDTEEQALEQQESEAMSLGFDSVRNPDEAQHAEQYAAAADTEPTDDPQESVSQDEQPVFAGMTATEIKTLLERASRFDDQLAKAHGKIGELNRTLQQITAQQPAPKASAEFDSVDDADLSEIEELFPEFAPAVEAKARRIAQEVMAQQQPAQTDPAQLQQTIALAVMDATRPEWRNTVQTEDFQKWIAAQPDDYQRTYASTWDTAVFSGVLTDFDAARRATTARTTKNQTRLEAALTPDSRTSRISHAATEMDAMQAGFDAVRNPHYSARH